MKNQFGSLVLLCLVATTIAACKSGAPAPAADDHHDHAEHHAMPAPTPDAPTGPRIETGSFVLQVGPTGSAYRVGKPGQVAIALEGRGDWHVNQDYPIRIDLEAPSELGLRQDALGREDAEAFNEDEARFVAGVEPRAAGAHDVTCDVSFAMCTDENCVLERRTIAMQVKVE